MKLTIEQKMERKRQRIECLKEEERRLKAQLRAQERRDDTRRKILLGSWILSQTGSDYRSLGARMNSYLVRAQDRKLFGLPPLPDSDHEDDPG